MYVHIQMEMRSVVYTYIYIHTCVYIHVNVYTHMCIYICTCVYTYIYTCVMHICVSVHIFYNIYIIHFTLWYFTIYITDTLRTEHTPPENTQNLILNIQRMKVHFKQLWTISNDCIICPPSQPSPPSLWHYFAFWWKVLIHNSWQKMYQKAKEVY